MSPTSAAIRFSLGNSSELRDLSDGEADLVITGPPYFSAHTEVLLRERLRAQNRLPQVERELIAFALSLRPVFDEIRRVLKPSGLLIVQTKDVRYAGWLVGLTGIHREMIESLGLRMLTRLWWQPPFKSRRHTPPRPRPGMHALFRVRDVEEFQVYGRPGFAHSHGPIDITSNQVARAHSPLWNLQGSGGAKRHPHQSPAAVARRLIALYTAPNDLVVDPFAGSGTFLGVALQLGRRVAGCELDPHYAAATERWLATARRRQQRVR